MRKYIGVLLLLLAFHAINANQLKIVFRYDDYTLTTNPINDSVVQLFLKNRIPLVLGVIPCNSDEKLIGEQDFRFLQALKEAVKEGKIEIALHGLNHLNIAKKGEFEGLDKNEQLRRIKQGKSLLDSVFQTEVISFIPPWNAYDHNTLDALHDNGFKIISSSFADKTLDRSDICYFPQTTDDIKQFETIIAKNRNRNGLIIVMIHAYNFKALGSLQNLDLVLTAIRQIENLDFYTFKSLGENGNCIGREQIKALWHNSLLSKMLKMGGVIYPLKFSKQIQALNAVMYLLLSLIGFSVSYLIFLRHKDRRLSYLIIFVFYEIILFIAVYNHFLTPVKLLVVALLSAALLPFVFSLKRKPGF